MDKKTSEIIKEAGGEVIKVIQMTGEVLEDVTLADLKRQTGSLKKFDTLVLEIASPGGSVSEGLAIMVWLEDISKQGKQIVTVVTANAYSIASLIMLVADIKLISTHAKVMVHNPMVPLLEYVNANDLQEYINSLRSLEDTMYQLYQFFTGLEIEQIKLLMDNETYLLPQEAVDNGFADMVVDIKQRSYSTASNLKKDINMSNTLNILNKVIGMVNKSEFINQLYSDLEGAEIEIFQKDPSTYMVGDRTSMAEGEVVLSDGAKLTIVGGAISEISRSAEESSSATDEVVVEDAPAVEEIVEAPVEVPAEEAPEVEKEEVIVEEAKATEVMTEEVAAIEVEAEAVVVEEVAVEAVAVDVVEEVAIEEVVVEAVAVDPIIEDEPKEDAPKIEEVEAAEFNEGEAPVIDEPKEEVEASAEPKMDEVTHDDAMAEMSAIIMDLSSRVVVLEQMCLGYDAKLEAINKFENIATEAIDTLASNSVSNFKPEAISTPAKKSGGSIFNQLKGKRGLK